MDAATAALKNYLARDSCTCYEIKNSDDHPSQSPGKFLLSLFCRSSSDVLCFKAAVLFSKQI